MNQNISPERQWKYQQVFYAEILKDLDLHFFALKVHYMPIKGAYLIFSGLAEKISCRRMDDIDILVKREDFDKVCDYFTNLPQVTVLKNKMYFEKIFVYSLGSIHCHFEIHWLINYPERFNLPTDALFMRASLQKEGYCLCPSHEDALLILLCHAFTHIGFEFRETLFEEISLVSGQKGFQWDLFWKYAHTTGIELFIKLLLSCFSMDAACNHVAPKSNVIIFLLRPLLSVKRYAHLPHLVKRLLFEIPFARNPWRLILNKMILSRHGNATSVNSH